MVFSKTVALAGYGLVLLLSAVGTASAANICVNSTAFTGGAPGDCGAACGGAGNCDIRDAVAKADLDNAPDTIIFDPSVFPPNAGTTISTNATLVLDTPVTLQGPGAGSLVLDNGGNGDTVLAINHDTGFSPPGPHTVSGMKITGGARGINATDYDADVVLDSLVISGNDIGGGSGDGAGIKVDNDNGLVGTVKIVNCLIVNNIATDGFGGGVETEDDSSIEIVDSFILGNLSSIGGDGGGMALQGGIAVIRNTVISDNEADDRGGGVYASNLTELTIVDSTISDNTALNDDGGGIYAFVNSPLVTMPITISRTSITGNFAGDRGGGVNVSAAALNDVTKLTLVIADSTLSSNTADGGGGGGLVANENTTTIDDTTLDGNKAGGNGGAILNDGGAQLTITRATLSRNSSALDGGAIQNSGPGSLLSIANATISGNSAEGDGGGISNNNNATNAVSLTHVTITGNTADSDFNGAGEGGGIEQESPAGAFTVVNSIIAGNLSLSGGPDCDTAGTDIVSKGNNILGSDADCSDHTFDPATKNDQVGMLGAEIDPLLGPLSPFDGGDPAHGLPMGIHELQVGSPALDAADASIAAALATDQRGIARPIGAAADIGAVEAGCGDGSLNAGETCDDGGESATCNVDCTEAACGDSVINATAGESCDDGNANSGDGCSGDCRVEACGNGVLDEGEACEDGNNADGDGCSSECQFDDAAATGDATAGTTTGGSSDGGGCVLIR